MATSRSDEQARDAESLAVLRREFPKWKVWRARGESGRPGAWMANPPEDMAGVEPTLMADSAEALAALMCSPRPGYARRLPAPPFPAPPFSAPSP